MTKTLILSLLALCLLIAGCCGPCRDNGRGWGAQQERSGEAHRELDKQ